MAKQSLKHHSRLDQDPTAMGWAVLLSCLISCLVTFLLFPPAHRNETVEEMIKRFGYAGPTRYEREIEVRLSDQAPTVLGENRLMGGISSKQAADPLGTPVPEKPGGKRRARHNDFDGLSGASESGEGAFKLRHIHMPTVQSEDLIALDLVRPEYPSEAIARGDTGMVELAALVNEHGTIDDVEVVRSAGDLLDQAATDAVKRCRFMPYRIHGEIKPVWAGFHIRFDLRE